MIIAFFVVAGFAAFLFLAAGLMKLVRSAPALKDKGMAWVDDFSPALVRLIGLAEVLGAIGLVLPVVTELAQVLSPLAGICLVVVMLGAVVVHRRRHEPAGAALGITVLTVAATVLAFIVIA